MDILITKQLVTAEKIIDIKVLDHIIVSTDGKYLSMRVDGIVDFT